MFNVIRSVSRQLLKGLGGKNKKDRQPLQARLQMTAYCLDCCCLLHLRLKRWSIISIQVW